jgi:hypothetical protein
MSPTEMWIWLICLFVLELNHLRWIWWEYWHCRRCGDVNRACDCPSSRRWVMYL